MSQDELSELDRTFIEHVRDVGIGFGKEGERYLSNLLEKLSDEHFIAGERRAALEKLA